MKTMSDVLNVDDFPAVEKCSLIQALRWISYGEKPLKKELFDLVYGEKSKFDYYSLFPSKRSDTIVLLEEMNHLAKMDMSSNALFIMLEQGRLELYGDVFSCLLYQGHPEDENLYESVPVEASEKNMLLPSYYLLTGHQGKSRRNDSCNEIDFYPEDEDGVFYKIKNIYVITKKLLEVFPDPLASMDGKIVIKNTVVDEKTPVSNRGAPLKYDWDNEIYPEIVMYIHENGISDNQSEMAREIYSICSQRYGEDKTPDIDHIRKKAIKPIVDRFKVGNNSQ